MFWLTFAYYIWHMCVSPMRQCVAHIHDPDTILAFDLNIKFKSLFTCFRVRLITFFRFDFGLPYLSHEMMCCIHSWSQYNVDLWPQVQIYKFLTCFYVWPITIFDLTLAYHIWHTRLSPWEPCRGCVAYIYDPNRFVSDS